MTVLWLWLIIKGNGPTAVLTMFFVAVPTIGIGLALVVTPAAIILRGLGHGKTIRFTVIALLFVVLETVSLMFMPLSGDF